MLHEALRLIRVFHDLKQSETAERLGISKSYLSEIEKGRKKPTLEVVEKYAATFEIPVSSIMFFSEHLQGNAKVEGARRGIARKILRLMRFLESRSGRSHEE